MFKKKKTMVANNELAMKEDFLLNYIILLWVKITYIFFHLQAQTL
jgi:hypothetical protein